jgi:hypothetical protein
MEDARSTCRKRISDRALASTWARELLSSLVKDHLSRHQAQTRTICSRVPLRQQESVLGDRDFLSPRRANQEIPWLGRVNIKRIHPDRQPHFDARRAGWVGVVFSRSEETSIRGLSGTDPGTGRLDRRAIPLAPNRMRSLR